MSYCSKCGAYIPVGDTACPACGFDPEAEAREAEAARRKAAAEARRKAAEEAEKRARQNARTEQAQGGTQAQYAPPPGQDAGQTQSWTPPWQQGQYQNPYQNQYRQQAYDRWEADRNWERSYRGQPKNKWVALALCAFMGPAGVHKFYEGKIGTGLLYLFTGGLFGVGWLFDFINLLGKPETYYVDE